MSTAQKKLEQEHCDAIRTATLDVFEQMIGFAPNETKTVEQPPREGDVVGILGFGGTRGGLAVVTCGKELAKTIAGALLMMEPDEIDDQDELSDAFGEVVNMILGGFKPHWTEAGNDMVFSVPSVTFGDPVRVAGNRHAVMSHSIQLRFDAGELGVTIAFHD